MMVSELMAGGKRENPDYLQISGYVPKGMGLQFKAACTLQELSQSEALEQAVRAWLSQNQIRVMEHSDSLLTQKAS